MEALFIHCLELCLICQNNSSPAMEYILPGSTPMETHSLHANVLLPHRMCLFYITSQPILITLLSDQRSSWTYLVHYTNVPDIPVVLSSFGIEMVL